MTEHDIVPVEPIEPIKGDSSITPPDGSVPGETQSPQELKGKKRDEILKIKDELKKRKEEKGLKQQASAAAVETHMHGLSTVTNEDQHDKYKQYRDTYPLPEIDVSHGPKNKVSDQEPSEDREAEFGFRLVADLPIRFLLAQFLDEKLPVDDPINQERLNFVWEWVNNRVLLEPISAYDTALTAVRLNRILGVEVEDVDKLEWLLSSLQTHRHEGKVLDTEKIIKQMPSDVLETVVKARNILQTTSRDIKKQTTLYANCPGLFPYFLLKNPDTDTVSPVSALSFLSAHLGYVPNQSTEEQEISSMQMAKAEQLSKPQMRILAAVQQGSLWTSKERRNKLRPSADPNDSLPNTLYSAHQSLNLFLQYVPSTCLTAICRHHASRLEELGWDPRIPMFGTAEHPLCNLLSRDLDNDATLTLVKFKEIAQGFADFNAYSVAYLMALYASQQLPTITTREHTVSGTLALLAKNPLNNLWPVISMPRVLPDLELDPSTCLVNLEQVTKQLVVSEETAYQSYLSYPANRNKLRYFKLLSLVNPNFSPEDLSTNPRIIDRLVNALEEKGWLTKEKKLLKPTPTLKFSANCPQYVPISQIMGMIGVPIDRADEARDIFFIDSGLFDPALAPQDQRFYDLQAVALAVQKKAEAPDSITHKLLLQFLWPDNNLFYFRKASIARADGIAETITLINEEGFLKAISAFDENMKEGRKFVLGVNSQLRPVRITASLENRTLTREEQRAKQEIDQLLPDYQDCVERMGIIIASDPMPKLSFFNNAYPPTVENWLHEGHSIFNLHLTAGVISPPKSSDDQKAVEWFRRHLELRDLCEMFNNLRLRKMVAEARLEKPLVVASLREKTEGLVQEVVTNLIRPFLTSVFFALPIELPTVEAVKRTNETRTSLWHLINKLDEITRQKGSWSKVEPILQEAQLIIYNFESEMHREDPLFTTPMFNLLPFLTGLDEDKTIDHDDKTRPLKHKEFLPEEQVEATLQRAGDHIPQMTKQRRSALKSHLGNRSDQILTEELEKLLHPE